MNKLTLFLIGATLLFGCENPESKARKAAQKAADTEMLKGEFTKSPVLDYRKYTTVAPKPLEPVEEAPNASPPRANASPSFKKSPILDYRKYLGEEGKR